MNDDPFKTISENIHEIMEENNITFTPKDLAEKSNISYSTLAPILRGERDFRISNLISIAEALHTTPNDLLQGLFKANYNRIKSYDDQQPKYLAVFITDVGLTHCRLKNLESGSIENKIFPFSLFCTNDEKRTTEQLKKAITEITGEINFIDVFLYISVLAYEHVDGRLRLMEELRKNFGSYMMEQDWLPVHHSLLHEKNGILITINNGYVISYSNDAGKTIQKIQGYSFPISDEAGNFWIGCEAIKHAINVKEGIEPRSMLSDKVLSLVNSDLNLLATKAYDYPREFFVEVAAIVKELSNKKDMAYKIVKRGFDHIWTRINHIDATLNTELPIYLSGALAYLYEEFVPKNRLIQVEFENIVEAQFIYAIKRLNELKEKNRISER